MRKEELKILIADDSIVYRKILKTIIEDIKNASVCCTASNGNVALKKLSEHDHDIILLDLKMPELDGFGVIKEAHNKYPNLNIIVISGVNDAKDAIDALGLGAIDVIEKPTSSGIDSNYAYLRTNIKRIVSYVYTKKITSLTQNRIKHIPTVNNIILKKENKDVKLNKILLLCIAVSTGGPKTLEKLIPKLPHNFNVPIIIVQHMPPKFTESLAVHLNKKSKLNVIEAKDKEEVLPGNVYIAPGGRHLIIIEVKDNYKKRYFSRIIDTEPVNGCRPSADVLLESVADFAKNNILMVTLTGMGSDGCNGAKLLKENGNYSIAQSENDCIVYGMPKSVVDAGVADEIIYIDNIADRLLCIVKGNQ